MSPADSSPLLIGLVGRSKAGKDTVGKILREISDQWVSLSFAAPLKQIAKTMFSFTDAQLSDQSLKEAPDPRYRRADGTYLTPREAMQKIGTEAGRSCYPHIWVDLAMSPARAAMQDGRRVAFTDCRFINEAQAIRNAGGEVWRIYRFEVDGVPAVHQSETEMNTPEMNALVTGRLNNNGTLEQLQTAVVRLLRAE